MRLGVAIADRDLPDDSGRALARIVDGSDVHSLWTNETGGADSAVTLGVWAAVTTRVTLGTGVVPLAARSLATLGLAARQISRTSGGRLVLGIGVGQRQAAEGLHGVSWRSPLAWTEEALAELRGNGYPVIVGALGPRMLELAARKADGVLLNWSTPEHARRQRALFTDAARAAGRDPGELLLTGYVRVAVGDGAAEALSGQVGFYSRLPFYRAHWNAMGRPADDEVTIASSDGSDLRERLSAYDALDVVIARVVPTEEVDAEAAVTLLCSRP